MGRNAHIYPIAGRRPSQYPVRIARETFCGFSALGNTLLFSPPEYTFSYSRMSWNMECDAKTSVSSSCIGLGSNPPVKAWWRSRSDFHAGEAHAITGARNLRQIFSCSWNGLDCVCNSNQVGLVHIRTTYSPEMYQRSKLRLAI